MKPVLGSPSGFPLTRVDLTKSWENGEKSNGESRKRTVLKCIYRERTWGENVLNALKCPCMLFHFTLFTAQL